MKKFLLLSLAVATLLMAGMASMTASAQTPSDPGEAKTCNIEKGHAASRGAEATIGDPGSGLPQAVHQTWRLNADCEFVFVDEEKIYTPAEEEAQGDFEALGVVCKWVTMQLIMDDAVGIDLTKLTSGVDWCFDTSQTAITYFGSGQASGWAQNDGWVVDSVTNQSYWYSQPYFAENLAHGMYHYGPTGLQNHNLENTLRLKWDGTRSCLPDWWGAFPIGYDIDMNCGTPS